MYCCGFARKASNRPARPRPRAIPPWCFQPEKRWSFAASASTAMNPALWRVAAYSSPGFPSPTTAVPSGVPPALTFLASLVRFLLLLLLHQLRLGLDLGLL